MIALIAAAMVLQASQPLTPIGGEDLEKLFCGVTATSEILVNKTESFLVDGTYYVQGRTRSQGRHWTVGDELCVQIIGVEALHCRRFGRGSDGEIYQMTERLGADERAVDPVKFTLKPV